MKVEGKVKTPLENEWTAKTNRKMAYSDKVADQPRGPCSPDCRSCE